MLLSILFNLCQNEIKGGGILGYNTPSTEEIFMFPDFCDLFLVASVMANDPTGGT